MTRYLLLLTLLFAFAFGAEAQFKFGLAAGYEHITSTPSEDARSGGGGAGSFLFQYRFPRHFELDLALNVGAWKTSPLTYYIPQAGPIAHFGNHRISFIHVVIPLHVCYVLPLKNYSLFGGPGIFWSRTSVEGGQNGPLIDSRGLSLLAGIRWRHWQLAADYRPWLHNYRRSGTPFYEELFDGKLSNDISLKAGFVFGRIKKKGHS